VTFPPSVVHGGVGVLRVLARDVLPENAAGFFETGARGEHTVRANERAWRRWWLRPRVLADVDAVALATSVLGVEVASPVLVAPMSLQRLAHPDGELAVARAVAAAGSVMMVSMGTSTPIEELAAVPGLRWWMQLYVLSDRDVTTSIARRAAAAGAGALVLTVDAPRGGTHARPALGLRYPDGIREALVDSSAFAGGAERRLGWDVVRRLQDEVSIPVVLKGILHPDDAARAVDEGVAAIVVSNHGGRILDGAIPTADALPGISAAVDGRLEILVDGGIRRGADVLRALALGARAAVIGRPVLWGLAMAGADGVAAVLRQVVDELETDAALCGVGDVRQVPRDLVARAVDR
jgi:4-hydroxymandelate oxidase